MWRAKIRGCFGDGFEQRYALIVLTLLEQRQCLIVFESNIIADFLLFDNRKAHCFLNIDTRRRARCPYRCISCGIRRSLGRLAR